MKNQFQLLIRMLIQKAKFFLPVLFVFFAFYLVSCSEQEEIKIVDKSQLEISIKEAKDLIEESFEGTAAGNYMRGSKAQLQNALDVAQIILDLPEATEATVIGANANLQSAITTFKTKVVAAIDPDNLIGHWTFDELSTAAAGTAVEDYSGNGNNGTTKAGNSFFNGGSSGVQPQLGTDRYGNPGKALVVNKGANVEVPYNASLNPAAMSISAWVKLAGKRSNRFVGLHSGEGFRFEVQETNRPQFIVHAPDTSVYTRNAETEIGLSAWYHLAVTFTAGKMKFFINGVLVKTWTDVPKPALSPTTTPYNLVLGCDFPTDKYAATPAGYDTPEKPIPVQWGGYLHGALDEVRMYKVAISDAQVSAIYELEKPD